MLVATLFFSGPVRADWITEGYFSEATGIDSLERFLVIRDIEDSTLFGWNILSVGDITSDGISDILVCRAGLVWSDNNAYLFFGGNPADGIYDREFTKFRSNMESIGDVSGDGYADFGMRPVPYANFELHYGGPGLDDSTDFVIPNIQSRIVKAADFDADGYPELPLSTSLNGGFVRLYRIDSERDTIAEYVLPDTSESFGNRLAVGDFNGDGHSDLAVGAHMNRDSCFVKFYWGGADFDTVPDYEIWSFSHDFGEIMLPLGDFNGDGYEDILICGGTNDPYGIYFGGPDFDGEVDLVINYMRGWPGWYFPPTSADIAGDINNDGHRDLIIGYSASSVFIDEIYVYLGGPETDSAVDIYIENYQMPGPQNGFGGEVAGIGDFNGDGIDDFAVRSQTQTGCCWWSEVNFFAGWDGSSTDVPIQHERTLPEEFRLEQNYPNPFNPTTTISFDVSTRSAVKLTIFNILGREVITLLDRTFCVGSYKVEWDGRDERGQVMPTGVYLYRLQMEGTSRTRKMLLLK